MKPKLSPSKMQEWERNHLYNKHMQRVRSISSPLGLNRSIITKQDKQTTSGHQFSHFRNGQKNEQRRKVDLENNRLLKKLSQIGRRKTKFALLTQDEENYYTIHLKSREVGRKIKFEEIQQENDLIVERILKMQNRKGLSHDPSVEQLGQQLLKKSRTKKKRRSNNSFTLPKIETPSLESAEVSQNLCF